MGPIRAAGGLIFGAVLLGAGTPAWAGQTGQQVFEARCVACHGIDGRGDGVAATGLNPKPRNFTDATWWEGRDDAAIKAVVSGGGAANGLSPLMPAWSGVLKDKEIDLVVAYLRTRFAPSSGASSAQ